MTPTATAERHMVFIETEKAGRIYMTPEQFDMLLECALAGLDGYPDDGDRTSDADRLHAMLTRAYARHRA